MSEQDREFYNKGCLGIILMTIAAALLIMCCSCTRTMYVPVTSVQHDSIYLHTHSSDSIVVRDSVTIREKGDTIWMTRWRTEYRDSIRIDTAYIERRDSVVVPYPVERKLSRKERLYMSAGRVAVPLACAGIALACLWIYRRKMT
jgi:hypothetical protein